MFLKPIEMAGWLVCLLHCAVNRLSSVSRKKRVDLKATVLKIQTQFCEWSMEERLHENPTSDTWSSIMEEQRDGNVIQYVC